MVEIKDIHGKVLVRLEDIEPDDLSYAFFDELDLSYANFEGADLFHAYFGFCNLTGANFRNADLRYAELKCNTIDGADFSGANLEYAVVDITTDLELDAITDVSTVLPSPPHHHNCFC